MLLRKKRLGNWKGWLGKTWIFGELGGVGDKYVQNTLMECWEN